MGLERGGVRGVGLYGRNNLLYKTWFIDSLGDPGRQIQPLL